MKIKQWLSCLLALTSCAGLVSCTQKEGEMPDYSAYNNRFSYYAYNPPTKGVWKDLTGAEFSAGEDFRTVEQYKIYKDCGFDILMMQSTGNYYGQDWETSDTKMVMDRAYEAGIEKCIVTDNRIQLLSEGKVYVDENGKGSISSKTQVDLTDTTKYKTASLMGEGKPFANETELDAYVSACMAPYRDYKNFYGVQLKDEPRKYHIVPYGEAYRAVKRVCPEAFLQWNLFQAHTDTDSKNEVVKKYEDICPAVEGTFENNDEKAFAMYEAYLDAFIDSTGSDYVMMDSYPLWGNGVRDSYIRNLQICAETAKEKQVDFAMVMQTHSTSRANGTVVFRSQDDEDLRWLNNMLLGFGTKQFVYYTYFAKGVDGSWMCGNEDSFISRYGERTPLYYNMQKIMKENQDFANVILNFDFVTSNVYSVLPTYYSSDHIKMAKNGEAFQKVEELTINKECALATELYDKENDRYMYMVQNIVDPAYKGAKAYQTATVTFKKGYTHALVYVNGVPTKMKLEKNALTFKQYPGEAVFILPY